MDSTNLHFLSLFLLQIRFLSGQLEPPSNVTLHCKNLHNIVEWNYTEITPGLRFRVDVGSISNLNSCSQPLWVDRLPLRADVSCFSHPKDSYFLTVTAVNGNNESSPAPQDGIKFAYFASLTEQICYLDFPSVNMYSGPQNKVVVQFDHPCVLYHHRLRECKKFMRNKQQNVFSNSPVDFEYTVVVADTNETHVVRCEDMTCETTLETSEKEGKFCLKIKGELQTMSVKPTQEHFCILLPPPSDYTNAVIGASAAAVVAIALIIFMFYCKFTKPSSPLPIFIERSLAPHHPLEPAKVTADDLSCLDPDLSSPTFLLATTNEECKDNFIFKDGSPDNDMRMPIGMTSVDHGAPEDVEQNDPYESRSPYLDGKDLESNDEDETVLSPYERRTALG